MTLAMDKGKVSGNEYLWSPAQHRGFVQPINFLRPENDLLKIFLCQYFERLKLLFSILIIFYYM
jgi:hypothetical protein